MTPFSGLLNPENILVYQLIFLRWKPTKIASVWEETGMILCHPSAARRAETAALYSG